MTPTKHPTAEAPPQSPADELTEVPESERPFDDADARMQGTDIASYIAQGYQGVQVGAVLADATEAMPEVIDQLDLEGYPFAVLDVREQAKNTVIRDLDGDEHRVEEYRMVIAAVQPLEIDRATGEVVEAGAIFIMVAGRVDSVLGQEFRTLMGVASPTNPMMFPDGLREVDLGGGHRYYTTRADSRKRRDRPVLFPKRAISGQTGTSFAQVISAATSPSRG